MTILGFKLPRKRNAAHLMMACLCLVACGARPKPSAGPGGEEATQAAQVAPERLRRDHVVFINQTDYQRGIISALDPGQGLLARVADQSDTDALLRASSARNELYLINATPPETLQVLDLETFALKRTVALSELTVEPKPNPMDIVVLGPSQGYLSFYGGRSLHRLDLETGRGLATVDLGDLADSDGYPEMGPMLKVGDNVWVPLQRLDMASQYHSPAANALLAVVDPSTDRRTGTIELRGSNPQVIKQGQDGLVYLACCGRTGWEAQADGGVERVDPTSSSTHGLVVTEAQLGGEVLDVEVMSPTLGCAMVHSTADKVFRLVAFDPAKGAVLGVKYEAKSIFALLRDPRSGWLYASVRSPELSGLCVLDQRDLSLVKEIALPGDPPSAMALPL